MTTLFPPYSDSDPNSDSDDDNVPLGSLIRYRTEPPPPYHTVVGTDPPATTLIPRIQSRSNAVGSATTSDEEMGWMSEEVRRTGQALWKGIIVLVAWITLAFAIVLMIWILHL